MTTIHGKVGIGCLALVAALVSITPAAMASKPDDKKEIPIQEEVFLRHRSTGLFLCWDGKQFRLADPVTVEGMTPARFTFQGAISAPRFVEPTAENKELPRKKHSVVEYHSKEWFNGEITQDLLFPESEMGSYHMVANGKYLAVDKQGIKTLDEIPNSVQLVPHESRTGVRYLRAPVPMVKSEINVDGAGLRGWGFKMKDNFNFWSGIWNQDGELDAGAMDPPRISFGYAPSVRIQVKTYEEYKARFKGTLFNVYASGDGQGLYLMNSQYGVFAPRKDKKNGALQLAFEDRDMSKASSHAIFEAYTFADARSLPDNQPVVVRIVDYKLRALVTPKPGKTALRISAAASDWPNTAFVIEKYPCEGCVSMPVNIFSASSQMTWLGDSLAEEQEQASLVRVPFGGEPSESAPLNLLYDSPRFNIQDSMSERVFTYAEDGAVRYGEKSDEFVPTAGQFMLLLGVSYKVKPFDEVGARIHKSREDALEQAFGKSGLRNMRRNGIEPEIP